MPVRAASASGTKRASRRALLQAAGQPCQGRSFNGLAGVRGARPRLDRQKFPPLVECCPAKAAALRGPDRGPLDGPELPGEENKQQDIDALLAGLE
ncbi:MAG: hypothetical protein IIA00_00280 [Proteobacteria bacterium]|nr:hypothetical protein [Pseudomonadota bacterium]